MKKETISKQIKNFLSEAGKKGGQVKSKAKTKASQANGKLGGRKKAIKASEIY